MTDKRIQLSFMRLFYALAFVFIAVALSKFAYITVKSYRLHEDVRQINALIDSDQKAYRLLLQHKAYVTSPAYVERIARSEFQRAKEGEINIAPIFPQGTDISVLESPQPTIQSERPAQPNWQKWWDLFFSPE